MILSLVKGIKHSILIFRTFKIKPPLIWHIFKVWDYPLQYFNGEIENFKSKFSAKTSVSPYIFYTKKAIVDTCFEIAPVSLQSRRGMVLFTEIYSENHEYYICKNKKKKITEPIFQTATATSSGLLKFGTLQKLIITLLLILKNYAKLI